MNSTNFFPISFTSESITQDIHHLKLGSTTTVLIVIGSAASYLILKRKLVKRKKVSVAHIPGPESNSFVLGEYTWIYFYPLSTFLFLNHFFFLCPRAHVHVCRKKITDNLHPAWYLYLGNLEQLYNLETGVVDWEWTRQYGGCVRIKGLFGVRVLFLSYFYFLPC